MGSVPTGTCLAVVHVENAPLDSKVGPRKVRIRRPGTAMWTTTAFWFCMLQSVPLDLAPTSRS